VLLDECRGIRGNIIKKGGIMRNKLLVVTLLAMLAGCAGIKIVKVTDDSTEGLRFYRPEPYLIVTSSSTTIQWLPNFKQEYAVQVRSG